MVVLKDTSLCAIVRDEMMNPAQLPRKSGIRSFVESHVPFVERAVIVDTGSVDGTREELEQLASEFPSLKVYDRPFDNYAAARNHSLSLVGTRRALVLDVDELVTQENFGELARSLQSASEVDPQRTLSIPYFFYVDFIDVESDGAKSEGGGHPIRLFDCNRGRFCNESDMFEEFLHRIESSRRIFTYDPNVVSTGANIFHFSPGKSGQILDPLEFKYDEWYSGDESYTLPPSKRKHFKLWKKPNPFRKKYQ
jgi:glycosyltransferase involved in cell wall biosynthesis